MKKILMSILIINSLFANEVINNKEIYTENGKAYYVRDEKIVSGVVVTETPLLYNSSAGMQMAYELQHKILSDPRSFVLHKRRGHSLDSLLLSKVYGNRRNKKV